MLVLSCWRCSSEPHPVPLNLPLPLEHIQVETMTSVVAVLSLFTDGLFTTEHNFARQWKILAGFAPENKVPQLMRGWGKYHYL